MATLVLGAVGTLVGGPLGGAIGTLVGRQVDAAVIGSPTREGPRLKDLAISTSTYGLPIARHFGQMRVPGTIIWATDLVEQKETSGGGKGKPKTTSYSYSVSLAVALSSGPVDAIGRIWADGNLLRGQAGDLKTGGTMRFYSGAADQEPDPLMLAALGSECPAYRGLGYVVFEDLQLADFGNRIPALTFEVFGRSDANIAASLIRSANVAVSDDLQIAGLAGFSLEGGSHARTLASLAPALPVAADTSAEVLRLQERQASSASELAEAIAWPDGEFGAQSGLGRSTATPAHLTSELRYYDIDRDYQPGLQRSLLGDGASQGRTFDLPGAIRAPDAGRLVQGIAKRHAISAERIVYRISAIDEAFFPGNTVSVPGHAGRWLIEAWEWRDGGVELELVRQLDEAGTTGHGESGRPWLPLDRGPGAPTLRAFELPWDGIGSPSQRQIFAAAGASFGRWAGAQLYASQGAELLPLDEYAVRRATSGRLTEVLGPSPALMFEPKNSFTVQLDDSSQDLQPASNAKLAGGANRALVGSEVLQFRDVEPLGEGRFVLSGLLRGRGGTERHAQVAHSIGTAFTLLDQSLVALDEAAFGSALSLAATTTATEEPVLAPLENAGVAVQPLHPVHGEAHWDDDGSVDLAWTRRARGAWRWSSQVDIPLIEEGELYEIGIGEPQAPLASFTSNTPHFTISAQALLGIAPVAGRPVWVRQIGDHARSPALLLTTTE